MKLHDLVTGFVNGIVDLKRIGMVIVDPIAVFSFPTIQGHFGRKRYRVIIHCPVNRYPYMDGIQSTFVDLVTVILQHGDGNRHRR